MEEMIQNMPFCSGTQIDQFGNVSYDPVLVFGLVLFGLAVAYSYAGVGVMIAKGMKRITGADFAHVMFGIIPGSEDKRSIVASVRWICWSFLLCAGSHLFVSMGVLHTIVNFFDIGKSYYYLELLWLAPTAVIGLVTLWKLKHVLEYFISYVQQQEQTIQEQNNAMQKIREDLEQM